MSTERRFKGLGYCVLGGSAYYGSRQNFDIDTLLEISEDCLTNNSYHLSKNEPQLNILKPSEWFNDEQLQKYCNEDFDFLFANPPCSGLSALNRWASSDAPINDHLVNAFINITKIKPKTFYLENAPTFLSTGFPLLKKVISILRDDYHLTILRDKGKFHNVPMDRARTIIFGFRKDCFAGPCLTIAERNEVPVKGYLDDIEHVTPDTNNPYNGLEYLFKHVGPREDLTRTLVRDNKIDLIEHDWFKKVVERQAEKLNAGKRIFDTSPFRPGNDHVFPSLRSPLTLIHPDEDRLLGVEEYAKIMNYPSDFKFFEGCGIDIRQYIAQGVPGNFAEYLSRMCKEALSGNLTEVNDEDVIVFQNHVTNEEFVIKIDDFLEFDKWTDVRIK